MNAHFSIYRFGLLCRQWFILERRDFGLKILMFVGLATLLLLGFSGVFSAGFKEKMWINGFAQTFLLSFGVGYGIQFIRVSFRSLREKDNSIIYLSLPASSFEKFLFEVLIRLGLMIVSYFVIVWISIKIIDTTLWILHPGYVINHLSLQSVFFNLNTMWAAKFTGICWIFSFMFLAATDNNNKVFQILIYPVFILLNIFINLVFFNSQPLSDIDWVTYWWTTSNAQYGAAILVIALVVHLMILTVAFFKLKEKEV